jgi:hypothetical protein
MQALGTVLQGRIGVFKGILHMASQIAATMFNCIPLASEQTSAFSGQTPHKRLASIKLEVNKCTELLEA